MVRSAAVAFGTLFRRIGPGFDTRRRAWRSGRGRSGVASALRKKRKMRRKPSLGGARPTCRCCRGRHALARHRRPVHGRPGGRVRREVRRAPSFASFASFARAPRCCRAEGASLHAGRRATLRGLPLPGARGRSPIRLTLGTRSGSLLIRHMSALGVYRPRMMGHCVEPYAARAAG